MSRPHDDIEFARRLERELNEAKAKLNAMVQADPRQIWNVATMEMAKERDAWRKCAEMFRGATNGEIIAWGMINDALAEFKRLKGNQ